MPSRLQSFAEVRYTNECQGYPCIVSVGQNEVVVGDWSGNLLRATLSPFAVQKTVFVASKVAGHIACTTLCSLAPRPEDPLVCAVATSGSHAAVWNSRKDNVAHVVSQSGPVHSVAWFGNARHLLLGTGDYTLSSGSRPQARIEVWTPEMDEFALLERIALPGANVDAIEVSQDGDHIVAFSGMKSQNQGFISILDARSFLPQGVFDLPFAMVKRLECTDELVIVSHQGEVQAFRREDGKEKWSHAIAKDDCDFAYDPDCHQLLLSNGELLSAGNGRVVETWPVLTDCCCVRARQEGGFVGVSKAGAIGVWTVNS